MGVCPVFEQVHVSSVLGLAMGVLGRLGAPLQHQLGLVADENVKRPQVTGRLTQGWSSIGRIDQAAVRHLSYRASGRRRAQELGRIESQVAGIRALGGHLRGIGACVGSCQSCYHIGARPRFL